jgi:hypothetical protein
MSCPCDNFEFPPRLFIPAGLSVLNRQIASFPEFRRALLHYLGATPVLSDWRGRQKDDFGVMLLEMWAYVCDVTAFYDKVHADETYVRTAVRTESLRQLIALLGYRPRPSVGARVDLAAFAEGRRAITLPAGTGFRSGAFNGKPPQIFELERDTVIHPLWNQWELEALRPSTFGSVALNPDYLLCVNGSVAVKKNDLVLVEVGAAASPRIITDVSKYTGVDGARYTKVVFDSAIAIPPNTPVSQARIMKPTITGGLWPLSLDGAAFSTGLFKLLGAGTFAFLDAIYRTVRAGQHAVFQAGTTLAARRITTTSQQARTVTRAGQTTFKDASNHDVTVPIPATTATVTRLELDDDLERGAFLAGKLTGAFISTAVADIAVHLGFIPGATVTVEVLTTLTATDALRVALPIEQPIDASAPGRFELEDKNNLGVTVNASLDYRTGSLHIGQDASWTDPLTVPVRLFGNVITATRGETVRAELLGAGDGAQANQSFKLKKSPLTYFPASTQGSDLGVANTLLVYVDDVLWKEVPSFFNVPAQAQVYIVRENNDGESSVTFGDGIRGQRLGTGARVTASYRFGAGAAAPPAGGIHQIARAVKGLRSVRNPVGACCGGDREPIDELRTYAPRSALLLGRAVSLADLEAATAGTGGVRAARAEWRWNMVRQRPVAQIYYIGDAALDAPITQKLRQLTEPETPIDVICATSLPSTLAVQLTINPSYLESKVLPQLRSLLMNPSAGLLAPERIGIGLALFRSRIFEFVLNVPGVDTVTDLQLNYAPFSQWGVSPGAGNYFDFESGSLLLNGKDANG